MALNELIGTKCPRTDHGRYSDGRFDENSNPKETQMTTRQNVNIDTLEGFRTFLKDNPDKGKLHLEAKAVYEGQAWTTPPSTDRHAITPSPSGPGGRSRT
jgi:hypothetical protein